MASRLRKKSKGWGARVRFGEKLGRDEWIALDLSHDEEPQARDRLARLQVMAKRLSECGKHAEARVILEEAGATRHERGFRAIETMVEQMLPEAVAQRTPKTFRQVVQDLCDGTLHDLYPDEIGYRTKEGNDGRRTQLARFFPALGHKLLGQITRDDIDEAKKLIPKDVKQNVRMRHCRELRFVMKLAIEPLRLCEHIPHVSVPKETGTDQFQLFYPDEEEQLAGATVAVSLEERFLYAFLCRNGPRISEALQYTWDAVDLERGKMRVAAAWTKTGRARFWDLEPDVLEALRLRRLMIPDAHLVFVPPPLRVFTRRSVYGQLHPNLRAAGLTRPELFETPEGERPLTTHDFRGSCVTLARNIGMSDRWIRDRTGHESPKMLEKYDRGVRHAHEQGLGWWAPMAIALGLPGAKERSRLVSELGPKPVQSWAKAQQTPSRTPDLSNRCATPQIGSHPFSPGIAGVEEPSIPPNDTLGPAYISISGQSGQPPQTIRHEPPGLATGGPSTELREATLRRLLELATRASDWDAVGELSAQLKAVEAGREPNVTSLDAARRRREGRS